MRWLLIKDLQILRRSPLLVAMLVIYPILIAGLVGFAVTSGPGKPRVALLNEVPPSQTQVNLGGETVNVADEAKALFNALDVVRVNSEQEAIQKVRDGEVLGALILPSDITQRLESATSGTGTPPT
ncbi:MAG: type transport system permease protein, partial [Thermoleophilaceae bacterium]|nr:type transport system permease protein [Thermoleophilaceae bacterium]